MKSIDIEIHHKIFKLIQDKPEISQREIARNLGVSLGKTNFCLSALVRRGWIKARNFKNSKNKRAYSYYLTASGVEEKTRLAVRFLKQKEKEYQALKKAIDELKDEIVELNISADDLSAAG